MSTAELTSTTPGGTHLLQRRLLTLAATIVVPLAIWLVVDPIAGHQLRVPQPGKPDLVIGWFAILFFTVLPGLAGWGLMSLLERVVPSRARTIWLVVAVVVLLASFLPLTGAGIATSTRLLLGLLHLVVGALLIAGLPRWNR